MTMNSNPYEPPQVECREPVPLSVWFAQLSEAYAVALLVSAAIVLFPISLLGYIVCEVWPDVLYDLLERIFPMERIYVTDGTATFLCPGCKSPHVVNIAGHSTGNATHETRAKRKPNWVWNGSESKPTLTPSVLITGHRPADEDCGEISFCCHSFVEAGMIRFLSDCTHELRGQVVPLPVLPDEYKPEHKKTGIPIDKIASKW